jgi:hypothetical protein
MFEVELTFAASCAYWFTQPPTDSTSTLPGAARSPMSSASSNQSLDVNGDDFARRLGPRRQNPLPWLFCSKCHGWSDGQARGWRIYRISVLDNVKRPEHVPFCPDCDAREFG